MALPFFLNAVQDPLACLHLPLIQAFLTGGPLIPEGICGCGQGGGGGVSVKLDVKKKHHIFVFHKPLTRLSHLLPS